jgi:tetratricopeptide (TPR) repeat protein
MMKRLCPSLCLLFLLVVPALAQETGDATETTPPAPEIVAVPEPQLETLEPSVARQLTEAKRLVDEALTKGAQRPVLAQAFGDLGTAYLAYEFRDSAMPALANARELNPTDLRWPYYLGHLALAMGQPKIAENLFVEALKLRSDHIPSYYYLAQALVEQQRPDDAAKVLERALADDPSCTAATALLGEIALGEKRYQEAVDLLEQALREQPAADRLYYPLGLAYRGLDQKDKARETLARRGNVGVRPEDPLQDLLEELKEGERVHILRGRMAFQFGRMDEAAAAFQEALEANPESIAARVNLGSAQVYRGNVDAAVALFQEVLERDPGNRSARFNLGSLAASMNDWVATATQMRAVLVEDPDDVEARRWLADALRRQGHSDEAMLEYTRVVQNNPYTVEAQIGLASMLVERQRYPEALYRLESALKLMPNDGRIVYPLARLLAACPNPALRDGARALQYAEALVNAQPTLGNVRLLAEALAQNDRCQEAEDWQRKAFETAAGAGDADTAEAILGDLKRFQAGPPCRPPGTADAADAADAIENAAPGEAAATP